jgi:N-acetylglucosamine-6-sulfatase
MGGLAVKTLAGLLLGFGLVAVAPPYHRSASFAESKPNILFVIADDLDTASLRQFPGLRSLLADRGVTFANHFVSLSLCCPSRASILRGQYAHNTEIFTNDPPGGGFVKFRDLGREKATIATWLRDAGYRTVSCSA